MKTQDMTNLLFSCLQLGSYVSLKTDIDLDLFKEEIKRNKGLFKKYDQYEDNSRYVISLDEGIIKNFNSLQGLIGSFLDVYDIRIFRLDKSGFFPPHRDDYHIEPKFLRVFVPLLNCTSQDLTFVLSSKVLNITDGKAFSFNARESHRLFSFKNNCCFAVIRLNFSEQSYRDLVKLLYES